MPQEITIQRLVEIVTAMEVARTRGFSALTPEHLSVFAEDDFDAISMTLQDLVSMVPSCQVYVRYVNRRAELSRFSTEELMKICSSSARQDQPIRPNTDRDIAHEIIRERLDAGTED